MSLLALALAVLAPVGCDRKDDRKPEIVIERDPRWPTAHRDVRPDTPPVEQAPARVPRETANRAFTPVKGANYEGYIRPAYSPEHFEPTADEIARVEERIPAAVTAARQRGDVPASIDIATYARQYAGYRKGDTRFIEIDLFCETSRHLASQNTSISGGGECFVHTAYDISTGRFLYWRTN